VPLSALPALRLSALLQTSPLPSPADASSTRRIAKPADPVLGKTQPHSGHSDLVRKPTRPTLSTLPSCSVSSLNCAASARPQARCGSHNAHDSPAELGGFRVNIPSPSCSRVLPVPAKFQSRLTTNLLTTNLPMQLYNTDFISPSTPSVLLQHTCCPFISRHVALPPKPGCRV